MEGNAFPSLQPRPTLSVKPAQAGFSFLYPTQAGSSATPSSGLQTPARNAWLYFARNCHSGLRAEISFSIEKGIPLRNSFFIIFSIFCQQKHSLCQDYIVHILFPNYQELFPRLWTKEQYGQHVISHLFH